MNQKPAYFALLAIAALGLCCATKGWAQANIVPNPGFEGDLGYLVGDGQGDPVPDYWRSFAVGGGGVNVERVPLPPNTLYPGSPATNAMRVTVTSTGGDAGFDHDLTPFYFQPGVQYFASVYMKSDNSDGSDQGVLVSLPVFDVDGFTGRQPGTLSATATSDWQKFSGPAFSELADTSGELAFRLDDDGGDNSILVAMPEVLGPVYEPPAVPYPPVYTRGRQFTASDRWVGTHVFHWFINFGGQIQGPWRPVEGRGKWTGEVPFWRDQIKDMMDANIEVIYLHLWNGFQYQREQFFEAIQELRREGYDTPLLMPFLDPLIIWGENGETIEVASSAGKDEYVSWYNLWLDQYFKYNTGDYADSRLVTLDGKFVLNTWHGNPNAIVDLSALSRQDVESRLIAANADRFPAITNGIYQIGTSNGVAPTFSDEIASQFSVLAYSAYIEHNGKRTAMLSPGNWDQNVRDPGLFLARDGGVHYEDVWNELLATAGGGGGTPPVRHLFLKSWNEYDEGTGLFASDTGPPYIAPGNTGGNDDVFSTTDNPREYIDTTYEKASEFNNYPPRDSRFLWNGFPTSMTPGQTATVRVLVRNEGNLKWSQADGFRLSEVSNGHAWGPANIQIDDEENEVEKYGGVFRGRPVLFEFDVTAPDKPGVYQAHYSMTRGGNAFGEELVVQVAVGNVNVQSGHSGAFYYPARDGEGNYVEVLDEERALVYTFSYRPDGTGPAWFIGVGRIEGGSIIIDDLLRPTGTSFGAGFNTNDIEYSPAGSMSIAFVDCLSNGNGGAVTYSGSEAIGFERLLSRAGRLGLITGCDSTPVANVGLSGSYFDPARNGEGIVVEWLTNGQVLVIMFTYDLSGRQFWVLGIGTPDGDSVTMDAIYPSTSTSWGSEFDPEEIVLDNWGTFTLDWSGECDSVNFAYESTVAGFGSAERNYASLTKLAGTECP